MPKNKRENYGLIRNVIFDLDDTLFDFKRSERLALSKTLEGLGIQPTDEIIALYSRINKGQWEALERGEATREVILLRRYEILFETLGEDIPPINAQRSYEKNLSETYFYIDGAEELLGRLQGKYRLYIASNGTARVQDGRIGRSGIARYFDDVFISEKLGHNKPSREFFDACFKVIGEDERPASIIIGDSLTSDILGGINAGITTCLYNPLGKNTEGNIKADLEIKSLDEIPAMLEALNQK